MKPKTIIQVIVSLLIVLFLYATIAQFVWRNTYNAQFHRVLPNHISAAIIEWSLPVAQLLLAYLLWRPATRLAALIFSLAIVGCFTVYLVIMLPEAGQSACHCGELWQTITVGSNILFNLFIIILIATAIVLTGRFKTDSPRFS